MFSSIPWLYKAVKEKYFADGCEFFETFLHTFQVWIFCLNIATLRRWTGGYRALKWTIAITSM